MKRPSFFQYCGYWIYVIVFFFGRISFIQAQVLEEEVRQAQAYYEAGDYPHAKAGYEGLLDEGLESWMKAILNYNIGISLQADGKWEEGIAYFQALPRNINLPVLKQRAASNLALARLMLLDEHLKALKNNLHASNENYSDMFILFRQVLWDIEKAVSAWCDLEAVEGAGSCPPSIDLQQMKLDLKIRFNEFLGWFLAYRLAHSSIQEGVFALLVGEKSLLEQLETFQDYEFSEKLKKNYLAVYLKQANSWKLLWEKLKDSLNEDSKSSHIEKQKDLFDHSREMFLESIVFAEQGGFHESIVHLENSRLVLNELMHQFFSSSSLKDVLQNLLMTYGLALIKDPIQGEFLDQILETQTAVEQMLKKSQEFSIAGRYDKAQKYLKLSIHSLADFHPLKARLFAEVARFYVKNIIELVDGSQKMKASSILKEAIAKEEFVLLISQLRQQIAEDEEDLTDLGNLTSELQQLTIHAADDFPEAVILQQKEAFNQEDPRKARCQCRPWDEVIPLFSEGYTAAEAVNELLQKKEVKQRLIESLQKTTIERWKEALAKMRASSSTSKQPSQGQVSSSQQSPEENETSRKEQQNAALNEILRLVQQMEKDDHSKPIFKAASTSNKGDDRPW